MEFGLSPVQSLISKEVVELLARADETSQGRIVFLAGEQGAGRSFTLAAIGSAARRETKASVISGAFVDGEFVPSARESASAPDVGALIESVVIAGSGLVGPAGSLLAQLVSTGRAAQAVIARLRGEGRQIEVGELLPQLLRAAVVERPLVCLVDDVDAADASWWTRLVLSFAQEMSEELPLVLVLSAEGPERLAAHDLESGVQEAARRLVQRDLADWRAVRRLTPKEMRQWLGPMANDLAAATWQLTGGAHGQVAELWAEWVASQRVRQDQEGQWRVAGDVDLTLTEAVESLNSRLEALLETADPGRLDDVRQLLVYAALDGRIFTAEAVALALGWNREDFLDFLDDHLATDTDAAPAQVKLLRQVRSVTVLTAEGVRRHVWQYEFVRALDWRVARERYTRSSEHPMLAQRLAPALAEAYAPEDYRVANRLTRLFSIAGDVASARHYRRIGWYGVGRTVLRSESRHLVQTSTQRWSPWELERAADLLAHACTVLAPTDPASDVMRIAQTAEAFSRRAGAYHSLGLALYYQAMLWLRVGDLERSTTVATKALAIQRRSGDRERQTATLNVLGQAEYVQAHYGAAREYAQEGLRVARRARDGDGEGHSLLLLGDIEYELERYLDARSLTSEALRVLRGAENREGEAGALLALAYIDRADGHTAVALSSAIDSLRIRREIGDRHGKAQSLRFLGSMELSRGRLDEAQALLDRSLAIRRELGDEVGEIESLQSLASVALERGRLIEAQTTGERARALAQEIGMTAEQASLTALLGNIHYARGHKEQAIACAEAALELHTQIGNLDGMSATWLLLAKIARRDRQPAWQRRCLQEVLQIRQQLGDLSGEADLKRLIDEIED